jgi:hypothetical protein
MNLTLKSTGSSFILPDVGVIIAPGAGSDFSGISGLIRALGQSVDLRNRVIAGTVVVNNGAADLSILEGQKYLNQMWLQSGHDIAVQMAQVEGVITDTQHGSRGGAGLHPNATPSVAGFMSPSDKTKSDDLGNSALPRLSYSFGDQASAGLMKAGAGYALRRYLRWPGTDAIGRTTGFLCKIVAFRSSGASAGSVRVYDETYGLTIVEQTGIAAASRTIYTPTIILAALATGESVCRVDLDGGSGSTVVLDSLEIY